MAVKEQIIRLKYEAGDANRAMRETNDNLAKIGTDGGKKAVDGLKNVESSLNRASATALSFGRAMAGVATGGIAAVTAAMVTLGPALERAQKVENVTRAFTELQAAAGQTATGGLASLREATQGLVSDFDLMKQANQAALLGLDQTKFDAVAGAAVKLGRSVGQDAVNSIESMVGALGRNSFELLDNLGITLRVEQAHREYADQLGKSVSQLTAVEKAESFRVIAMQKIIEKASQLSEGTRTAGEAWVQFGVALQNTTDLFASAINQSGVLASSIAFLTERLKDFGRGLDVIFNVSLTAKVDELAQLQQRAVEIQESLAKPRASFLGASANAGLKAELEEIQKKVVTLSQEINDKLPRAAANGGKKTEAAIGGIDEKAKKAAEKVATLRRDFEQLGQGTELKGIGEQLENAIKGVDRSAFDSILPKFQETFRRLKTDELGQKYGKAVEDAKIQEEVESQLTLATQDWEEKMGTASERAADKLAKEQERAAEEFQRAQERAFEESTDFFSGLLEGIFDENGSIEDTLKSMFKRVAIQFGAELLAQLTGNFTLRSVLGLGTGGGGGGGGYLGLVQQGLGLYNTGSSFLGAGGTSGIGPVANGSAYASSLSGGTGTTALLAGASVSSIAATAGVAAAAYFAYEGFQSARTLTKKPSDEFSRSDAVQVGTTFTNPNAAIAYGINDVFGGSRGFTRELGKFDPGNWLIYALDDMGVDLSFLNFGSGKDQNQRRRDAYRDYLFERDVISDPNKVGLGGRKAEFNLFGGGYGSLSTGEEFTGLKEGAGEFTGLANLLSFASTGGIETDLVALFANALSEADSFNAAVLTTRGLLEQMGLDAETAGHALIEAYFQGDVKLGELNDQINTLTAAMQNDLPSSAEAFDLLADSLDDPRSAVQALGLTLQELEQEGITTTDGLIAAFTERFGPEAAEAFRGILEAGITTLDALNNASIPQLQVVVNELDAVAQSQGVNTEAVRQYGDESERASEKSVRGLQKENAQLEKNKQAYEDARRAKARYFSEGASDNFGTQPAG